MLPFLNQDAEHNATGGDNKTIGRGSATNTSSGTSGEQLTEAGQDDYLTVADRGSTARRGTIILACVIAVGLSCLFMMIKKATHSGASAAVASEDAQIEAAIAQLTGVRMEFSNRADQIVDKFHLFSDVQKIQIDNLQKNPFVIEKYMGASDFKSEPSGNGETTVNDESLRKNAMEGRLREMKLLTIMGTNKGNCCMIDDKLLYVGDSIAGFKVEKIDDSSVELTANGMKFIMKIAADF